MYVVAMIDGRVIKEGDYLSFDGNTGLIFDLKLPTQIPEFNDPYLMKILSWVDDIRVLGVRLGITVPGLYQMQVRAIFEAACRCASDGIDVHPEVMIPLVSHESEFNVMRTSLEQEAYNVMEEQGVSVPYMFGTMIEIPRAALTAAEIAQTAEFFSFGTNDLTQTTYGISRDDAESGFLVEYLQSGLLKENPFTSIDTEGVGRLMRIAIQEGRGARKDLEIGVCGEHGGDPKSIHLCHKLGVDYVSCSPFRIPIARLAAAHAALDDVVT